jgi:acetylornithine deacetylase/succinyl-diaminopimelate desuccinylase-like protein
MSSETFDAPAEVVDLLQQMIRNRCVNDGTVESGEEHRNVDLLDAFFAGSGLAIEKHSSAAGRESLIARIEGSDREAPSLLLMGHTDVVPVNEDRWRNDPFGGELIDGEIWGRGAIDMLNLTSSMAVATKHLARIGWRPRGTLIYLGVADEEAGGHHGAAWLVKNELDAVGADFVITESGGWTVQGPSGSSVVVTVGEKGVAWRRLRVHGTPAHGSMPFGADNALVTAAEVVRRIAGYRPAAEINDVWRAYAASLDLDAETRAALVDPARVWDACQSIPDVRTAKFAHACTHTTFSPDVVRGGTKTNVIPDEVVLDVDVRILPGQTGEDVDRMLADMLGPLTARVTLEHLHDRPSSQSPTDTPLWHAIERLVAASRPQATLLPRITAGGTDATVFRDTGSIAYGFGLLSKSVTYEDFSDRFHGNDERIDVESLRLTTQCWLDLCTQFLG